MPTAEPAATGATAPWETTAQVEDVEPPREHEGPSSGEDAEAVAKGVDTEAKVEEEVKPPPMAERLGPRESPVEKIKAPSWLGALAAWEDAEVMDPATMGTKEEAASLWEDTESKTMWAGIRAEAASLWEDPGASTRGETTSLWEDAEAMASGIGTKEEAPLACCTAEMASLWEDAEAMAPAVGTKEESTLLWEETADKTTTAEAASLWEDAEADTKAEVASLWEDAETMAAAIASGTKDEAASLWEDVDVRAEGAALSEDVEANVEANTKAGSPSLWEDADAKTWAKGNEGVASLEGASLWEDTKAKAPVARAEAPVAGCTAEVVSLWENAEANTKVEAASSWGDAEATAATIGTRAEAASLWEDAEDNAKADAASPWESAEAMAPAIGTKEEANTKAAATSLWKDAKANNKAEAASLWEDEEEDAASLWEDTVARAMAPRTGAGTEAAPRREHLEASAEAEAASLWEDTDAKIWANGAAMASTQQSCCGTGMEREVIHEEPAEGESTDSSWLMLDEELKLAGGDAAEGLLHEPWAAAEQALPRLDEDEAALQLKKLRAQNAELERRLLEAESAAEAHLEELQELKRRGEDEQLRESQARVATLEAELASLKERTEPIRKPAVERGSALEQELAADNARGLRHNEQGSQPRAPLVEAGSQASLPAEKHRFPAATKQISGSGGVGGGDGHKIKLLMALLLEHAGAAHVISEVCRALGSLAFADAGSHRRASVVGLGGVERILAAK